MTREEIVNEIKCLLSELDNGENAVSYLTQNDVKWLNENIKALEQEPILDKIQEEIKRVDTVCHASNNHDELIRRNVVLQIIDKYKAEEAEAHPINENIAKGFEEFTKMMFRQGHAEGEKDE